MKIPFLFFVSVFALLLGGCETSRPLIPDEEYDAIRGPAPHAPDPAGHLPRGNYGPGGRY